MTAKIMVVVSALVLIACGEQQVDLSNSPATLENAAAAVVVFEGDAFEADEQLQAIQELVDPDAGRPFRPNIRSTTVFTEGGPSGSVYAQLIFQTIATTEDRQLIADRVAELGLDSPIWLGPDDVWPFCGEEPCNLVRDDAAFPN